MSNKLTTSTLFKFNTPTLFTLETLIIGAKSATFNNIYKNNKSKKFDHFLYHKKTTMITLIYFCIKKLNIDLYALVHK